jgi:hypothetical protein
MFNAQHIEETPVLAGEPFSDLLEYALPLNFFGRLCLPCDGR